MAENVADNILTQIVEETTKHNENVKKQMAADRSLLGKLIAHNEMRDQKQDEQDKVDAEHQGIQTHLSQLHDHKLNRIDDDLDERPDMAAGKDDTRHDSKLAIVTQEQHQELLKETKQASKDNQDSLEVLQASTEKAFGATLARWTRESKEWIEDNATFSKLAGNIKADFSILFGKLSLIQNVPGWKTMMGFAKFVMAWLTKFALGKLFTKFPNMMEKITQWVENFQLVTGKRSKEDIKEAREQRKKIKDAKDKAADELKDRKKKAPGILRKTKERLAESKDKIAKKLKEPKKSFKTGWESGKEGSDRRTKTGRKTQKQFKGMTKGMGTIGKIMANIGRGLAIAGSAMSAAFTALITGVTAITAPVWGIVALVILVIALLVVAGIYIYKYWQEINDWFDKLKINLRAAMDQAILFKDKAVNWFSDMGSRLGFMIKRLIAVVLDGIGGVVNSGIDYINDMKPDWMPGGDVIDESWKMDTGRTARADAARADFEAKSAERGKELEQRGIDIETARQDSLKALSEKQGGGGMNQQINNTSTQQSNTDISIGTRPSDSYAKSIADNHG